MQRGIGKASTTCQALTTRRVASTLRVLFRRRCKGEILPTIPAPEDRVVAILVISDHNSLAGRWRAPDGKIARPRACYQARPPEDGWPPLTTSQAIVANFHARRPDGVLADSRDLDGLVAAVRCPGAEGVSGGVSPSPVAKLLGSGSFLTPSARRSSPLCSGSLVAMPVGADIQAQAGCRPHPPKLTPAG
jgi:hypothetical protein